MIIGRDYLLKKPAGPSAPKLFLDTQVVPLAANIAGTLEVALDRASVRAKAPFDLVLCDAPCSGSGTWRRTPEAKWRLRPERLAELAAVQAQILDEAAALVAVGGRLAYATCSVLTEENQDIVSRFESKNVGWTLIEQIKWPVSGCGDGFFLAQFCRSDSAGIQP